APGPQRGRRWADPGQPRLEHGFRELRALGEEAVAGMDGVGTGLPRSAHMLGRVQVGRDLDESGGTLRGERTEVGRSSHTNCLDSRGTTGAKDAERDLPTVGDEQAAHGAESRLRLAERTGRAGAFGSTLHPRLTDLGGGTNIAVRVRLGVALLVAAVACAT